MYDLFKNVHISFVYLKSIAQYGVLLHVSLSYSYCLRKFIFLMTRSIIDYLLFALKKN